MAYQLIKVDKNGTKYLVSNQCDKCGGKGGSDAWSYTGWTCYRCNGTGIDPHPSTIKEYTPEYQAKLDLRRAKKAAIVLEKAISESEVNNKLFLHKNGYNEQGNTYYVLGNTFDIKEELKLIGGKYDPEMKMWHLPEFNAKYIMVEVKVSEMYTKDLSGTYNYGQRSSLETYEAVRQRIIDTQNEMNAKTSDSNYFGEEGKRYDLNLKYLSKYVFSAMSFGYPVVEVENYIYKFEDEQKNIFTWKTATFLDIKVGELYKIKGTIKSHNEYKGIKQNIMNRCKVIK